MNEQTENYLVLMLLATVLLRVFLVVLVAWLILPARRQCPQCAEPTVPVVDRRLLQFLLLERRWCMSCGWSGLGRRGGRRGPGPAAHPTVTSR